MIEITFMILICKINQNKIKIFSQKTSALVCAISVFGLNESTYIILAQLLGLLYKLKIRSKKLCPW